MAAIPIAGASGNRSRLALLRARVKNGIAARVPAPRPGSLEGDLSRYVEARYELFAPSSHRHECDRAPEPRVEFTTPAKVVYVTRGLDLWPQMGLALTRRWRSVVESALSAGRLEKMLKCRRPFPVVTRRVPGLVASINGGTGWENYYHWTIDCLPRVWGLFDERVRALGRVTLLMGRTLTDDQSELLRAMLPPNVHVVEVEPDEIVRPDALLLLPCLAGNNSAYLPPPYLDFFRDRVLDHFGVRVDRTRRERVYVSRAGAKTRRMKNERDLLDRLAPLGFESYRLEDETLYDQVRLFAHAEIVTGPDGAGFANVLFAHDCYLAELFAHHRVQPHYRRLMAAMVEAGRSIRYGALPGSSPTRNGPFTVDVDEVVRFLGLER